MLYAPPGLIITRTGSGKNCLKNLNFHHQSIFTLFVCCLAFGYQCTWRLIMERSLRRLVLSLLYVLLLSARVLVNKATR